MPGDRIEDEREAVLHVLHLAHRVFAIPGVDRANARLGVPDQERQLAGGDDREAPGLIARIDVGEVDDAVARHVVVVERLAELLRRIDLGLDGAVRGLLDRCPPFLHRLLQRMRRRHPVRELEVEGLVLGAGGGRCEQQRSTGHQCCNRQRGRPERGERPLGVGAQNGTAMGAARRHHLLLVGLAVCRPLHAFSPKWDTL